MRGTTIYLLAALALAAPATGHSFYAMECCSGQDCAPVDKVEVVAGATFFGGQPMSAVPPSVMIVTTRHGTVVVPQNFKTRESPDGQMHACIHNGKLLCLYLPPTG